MSAAKGRGNENFDILLDLWVYLIESLVIILVRPSLLSSLVFEKNYLARPIVYFVLLDPGFTRWGP